VNPPWKSGRFHAADLALLVTRWRFLLALAGVTALLCLAADPWLQLVTDLFGRRTPGWVAEDFRAFYAAGWLVAHGRGSLLYDPTALGAVEAASGGTAGGAGHTLAYFNPPFFALLCAPISWLPFDRAFQVWTGISLALLGLDLWLLWLITTPLRNVWRLVLVAGFAALYPISYGLRLGQFSLLLIAAWSGAYLLLCRGRPRTAGVVLALLLVKPELLLPPALFLAWKRRGEVFRTLIPITAMLCVVSARILGWSATLAYPAYLAHSTTWQSNGVATQLMFGWNGLFANSAGALPRWSFAAAPLLSGAGIVCAAGAWRGEIREGATRFAGQWLLLTLATLLSDPHLYLQDLVLVVPALLAWICGVGDSRRSVALAGAAGAAVVLELGLYPSQHLHTDLATLTMGLALSAWPIARLLGVARRARRDRVQRLSCQASLPSSSSTQSA
jgi:hypothetical protein